MKNFKAKDWFFLIVGLLFAYNLLVQNYSTALWDEDEAAYAGFALEMVESGNWTNPNFMWSDHHRKPPLHFWSIAICYKLFGVNEFSTRLPGVLSSILTLLVVYFFGRNVFGKQTSLLAAAILTATLMISNIGKMAFTDGTLLLFETAAILSILNFIRSSEKKWMVIFVLSTALGILTKGPPILILTGGFLFVLIFFKGFQKQIIKFHPWFLFPIAIIPFAIWAYVSWRNDGGELLNFMFNWYVKQRVSGGGTVWNQTGAPGYHLVIMLISFIAFLPLIPLGFYNLYKGIRIQKDQSIWIMAWLLFGWIFYEIMPSKLPAYAIGSYPVIAYLLADTYLNLNNLSKLQSKILKTSSVFFMLIMFGVVVAIILGSVQLFGRELLMRSILIGTVLWTLGVVVAVGFFSGRYRIGFYTSIIFGLSLSCLVWTAFGPGLDDQRSINRKAAEKILEAQRSDFPVYIGRDVPKDPSIPFYLRLNGTKEIVRLNDVEELQRSLLSKGKHSVLLTDDWYGKIDIPEGASIVTDSLSGRAFESLEELRYRLIYLGE